MALDLIGQKFGKLTVVEKIGSINIAAVGKKPNRQIHWNCICDCGGNKQVTSNKLKFGGVISCGCLYGSIYSKSGIKRNKYGMSYLRTKEYSTWVSIRRRCLNPSYNSYQNYGGRGIKVCERWMESFQNFLDDMGYAPSKNHSIDRFPDNDGHYEPGNCRWATMAAQSVNRRNNTFIEFGGERLTISQWSRRVGCSFGTLSTRLQRGKPVDDILSRHITYQLPIKKTDQ